MCRKALANALAAAPSMWTLGNAGMGALQVQEANSELYKKQKEAEAVLFDEQKKAEAKRAPSTFYTCQQVADDKLYSKKKETECIAAVAEAQGYYLRNYLNLQYTFMYLSLKI
ncbi:Flotillin-like protein 6 [Camellia lanceoleosa]|uniref:Flotillin-like protein 6 n=1 Tax=Camellia lanceoleosa TaxID=1840588 RepID=A0ACC0HG80_9ERIC|nr:Flotillin-like protein 6 [Camellia lanceoleosa]